MLLSLSKVLSRFDMVWLHKNWDSDPSPSLRTISVPSPICEAARALREMLLEVLVDDGVSAFNTSREELRHFGFDEVNFQGIALPEHNFTDVDFSRANLVGATFERTDFTLADLSFARLGSANLESATFSYADLTCANLSDAHLFDADLDNANLTAADLTAATLLFAFAYKADFSFADLTGADLENATLTGANFTGADLTDTSLLTAQHLKNANFYNATLPDSVDRPALLARRAVFKPPPDVPY